MWRGTLSTAHLLSKIPRNTCKTWSPTIATHQIFGHTPARINHQKTSIHRPAIGIFCFLEQKSNFTLVGAIRVSSSQRKFYRIGPVIPVMAEPNEVICPDLSPPEIVKGMTELDRDLFVKTVRVSGVALPQKLLNKARKKLWKYVLRIPKIVPIRDYSEDEKIVLLDPKIVRSRTDVDSDFKQVIDDIVDFEKFYQVLELKLVYENWNADDVLRAILPEGENISAFSVVGHVAHFNLKPCHEAYKPLIGQVILDKIKNIRTVVNKTDGIDNVYRFFKMELLAGDDDTIVTVKENGVSFKFDFAKVYWNSRLGTEHERIVDSVSSGDLVYDVFAGVGPFAVPCARKGATVFANDLNPESYKWLNENTKLNSSKKYRCSQNIHTYNMDGREFIRQVVCEDLKKRTDFTKNIHIVMNLPALAVEFLDAFVGLFQEEKFPEKMPNCSVYCYTFSKAETDDHDHMAYVRAKTEEVLGQPLPVGHVIRFVRNVSPNKEMMCVKFGLERRILVQGSERKRAKLDVT